MPENNEPSARQRTDRPARTATSAPTQPEQLPLWRQATTDVIAQVVDVEIDVLLRRPVSKERALGALAARQEIADRMRRHRWLAIETARRVGATWEEIDRTLGRKAGQSRLEYVRTLYRQKEFGLASPGRADPGAPTGPEL
jgi:hypothetical protein